MNQSLAGTILEEILEVKRRRVREAQAQTPLSVLMSRAVSRPERRSFRPALAGPEVRIIAEMKKASPAAGLLRENYVCGKIARSYEKGGAVALSVLTEEDYFQGSLSDLVEACSATRLPVLRKDFIVDEYQVYEAAAAGADAVLLIVAALPEALLRQLIDLAGQLQLAALVEAHTEEETRRAVDAGASIIGVNNRNLKTMEVNLAASLRLREKIPAHCLAISESGIHSASDVKMLMDAGFDALLVGESFMRSERPGDALKAMIDGAKELLHSRPVCEAQ